MFCRHKKMDGSICEKSGLEAADISENAQSICQIYMVDENVRSSLQSCPLQEKRTKLPGLLSVMANKNSRKGNVIHGLLFVLDQLLVSTENGKAIGYLQFNTAYDLYSGFFDARPKVETFRDNLLHPQHGLCVLIASIAPNKR